MTPTSKVEIIDVTKSVGYERYLYKCLSPMPFRRYRARSRYLESAIPRALHKKVLFLNGDAVGQIEYASPEASGYPITGNNIIVMNCIWVLRRAKGHNFGRLLMREMMESESDRLGFATISLEGHWSPWFKRWQMEMLGFRVIDSIEVMHRTKHPGERFKIHLMWLPRSEDVEPPEWDEEKMLEGVDFCMAHPLYHPQRYKERFILRRVET